MSYAYLFKYIIIGDTGKCQIWQTKSKTLLLGKKTLLDYNFSQFFRSSSAWIEFASSYAYNRAIPPLHLFKITRSLLKRRICVFLCFLSRCRQVLPAPPIHRQEVPTAAWPDHRSRVWSPHDPDPREEHQAADLGYSRPGVFQEHHTVVLSRGGGRPPRLWHYETRHVYTSDQMAGGSQVERQPRYVNHANWQ